MIRIKQIDPDDEEAEDQIDDLHMITFGDTAPMLRPLYGHWWVAHKVGPWDLISDEPVAFAGYVDLGFPDLQDIRFEKEPGVGYMKRCGVMQASRGQGIQRKLIRVREQHARKLGLKRMITDTTDNIQSANNLIRAGYRLYEPQAPWAFKQSLYWKKELEN